MKLCCYFLKGIDMNWLEGEKVFRKTSPHFLSMLHIYICWIYIGALGFCAIIFRKDLMNLIGTMPIPEEIIFLLIWSCFIILPALIVSFVRINWYWLLFGIILCFVGIVTHLWRFEIFSYLNAQIDRYPICLKAADIAKQYWPFNFPVEKLITISEAINYWLILVSFIGIVLANSYRRSHRYYITNRRIITRFGFLISKERDLLYSKVDDLIVHKDFIGKIFDFGTLIPISASGIGTGSKNAILIGGAEKKMPLGPTLKVSIGGGQSVTVPKAPSFYSLYGVVAPNKLRNIMLKEMEKREYGYTRRLKEDMQK